MYKQIKEQTDGVFFSAESVVFILSIKSTILEEKKTT